MDALTDLVDDARTECWRWECQSDYSAIDSTLMRRWRAGLGRDPAADVDWIEFVGRLRRRGVRFERLRMLTDPPTEYLRMQLDFSAMNVTAGEDLRWIPAASAAGAPTYDFYLLDDTVAVLRFGATGHLTSVRVSTDPDLVHHHRAWRDCLWINAVPHDRMTEVWKAQRR
ncbi:MAG TPA: hypothetical protein VM677_07785 [Actinokineospora sp.]|nr:hypothetical protein [Actinokineospora sp.]